MRAASWVLALGCVRPPGLLELRPKVGDEVWWKWIVGLELQVVQDGLLDPLVAVDSSQEHVTTLDPCMMIQVALRYRQMGISHPAYRLAVLAISHLLLGFLDSMRAPLRGVLWMGWAPSMGITCFFFVPIQMPPEFGALTVTLVGFGVDAPSVHWS